METGEHLFLGSTAILVGDFEAWIWGIFPAQDFAGVKAITWKIVFKTTDYPDFTDVYIVEPKKISKIRVISGFLPLIPQVSPCLCPKFLPYLGTLANPWSMSH